MGHDTDDLSSMAPGEFWMFMSLLLLIGLVASFYLVRLFHQISQGYAKTDTLMGDFEDDMSIQSLVDSHRSFQQESRVLYPTGC